MLPVAGCGAQGKHPQIFPAPVAKQQIINILGAVVALFHAAAKKLARLNLADGMSFIVPSADSSPAA
jgi:hypothetical protein